MLNTRFFLQPSVSIVSFLLLGLLTVDASAQAWPQAQGSAYLKLSHGRATAAEQYRFDGETTPGVVPLTIRLGVQKKLWSMQREASAGTR